MDRPIFETYADVQAYFFPTWLQVSMFVLVLVTWLWLVWDRSFRALWGEKE